VNTVNETTLKVWRSIYSNGVRNGLLLLVALLILPAFSQAASWPTNYQQKGYFYKPSTDSVTTLVSYFNNFVLTKGDEKYRDSLKAKGVTSPFLQYIKFDAIQDPGSCTKQPAHNHAADKPGDFCDISKNHPDWFLLDVNGQRMYGGSNGDYVMMDPGNTGWRAFFLSRLQTMQTTLGWDGALFDNVEGSLVKRQQYGQMPAKYTTDAQYQAAINGALAYYYAWFKSAKRPLFANVISVKPVSVYFTYLQNLDGIETECWAVNWSGYRKTADWLENLSRAEQTQSLGKRGLLIAQGAKTDAVKEQFAYASFLLIDNAKVFFRYANAATYVQAWTYSNYKNTLGIPLGARYQSGTQWCRDYSKGKVCVDPAAHTSSITTF
jgi:hypothetical protein